MQLRRFALDESARTLLPATGASSPAWTWGAKELGVDLLHHVVYVGVTSAAFEWLDHR